ncbi:MAG: phasin family protein [Alphaproteobacteria bacterium]|nr:phasin family protein [Alphaproteobacteria bacterium]
MVANTEQMENATANMMKAYQDMSQIASDSVNAAMQSASVVTKGYEELLSSIGSLAKNNFETTMSASKAIFSSKSIQEAMSAQASALKANSDSMLSGVNKLSEISARIAQDALNPVAENMNTAISRVAKTARAA